MKRLSKIVNNQYNFITKNIIKLNNLSNDDILHNSYRIKYMNKNKNTYTGNTCCGAACFILGKILIKQQIPVKMYLYKFGYSEYYQDHVHLRYEGIIIDPTYKQFFNINAGKGISKYDNYLYNNLPPFFVGTHRDLVKLYKKLDRKSMEEFDNNLDSDLLDFWKCQKDITNLLYLKN